MPQKPKQIIVFCANCRKELSRSPSQIKGKYHFCNKKCKGLWMREHPETTRMNRGKGKFRYIDDAAPICTKHDERAMRQHGYPSRPYGCWYCRSCDNEKTKFYRRLYKNDLDRYLKVRLWSTHAYSRKIHREFTITFNDLHRLWERQKGHCAITGLEMAHAPSSAKDRIRNRMNVSMDRIDSTQGYTPNNVWLVCEFVNRAKQDLTKEELLVFANGVLRVFA